MVQLRCISQWQGSLFFELCFLIFNPACYESSPTHLPNGKREPTLFMSLSMNKLNKKARLWDFLILMVLGFPRLPGPPTASQVYPGIKGLSRSGHPRPSGTGGGFRTKPLTPKRTPGPGYSWFLVFLIVVLLVAFRQWALPRSLSYSNVFLRSAVTAPHFRGDSSSLVMFLLVCVPSVSWSWKRWHPATQK